MTESSTMWMWASSDVPSPERLEAIAAAVEIVRFLGLSVSETVISRIADNIQNVAGAAERRAYDLGWRHCYDAIRE